MRSWQSNQRLCWDTSNKLRASSRCHPLSCFHILFYSRIVETYAKIEATTKRLEITRLLVELIDATPHSIIDKVVYLTQGKLYPDFLGIELGVAEKLMFRALARVTGQAESKVATLYKTLGDLGTIAEQLLKDRTQVSFQRKAPTV